MSKPLFPLPLFAVALLPCIAHAYLPLPDLEPKNPLAFTTCYGTLFPTLVTSMPTDGSSKATEADKARDAKLRLARDDAAAFIASAGDIRGVALEAALSLLREEAPNTPDDDFQLAAALLVY